MTKLTEYSLLYETPCSARRCIPCQHSVLFVEDESGRKRNEQRSAIPHDYCEFDRAERDSSAKRPLTKAPLEVQGELREAVRGFVRELRVATVEIEQTLSFL